jgi:hypothetical protein
MGCNFIVIQNSKFLLNMISKILYNRGENILDAQSERFCCKEYVQNSDKMFAICGTIAQI